MLKHWLARALAVASLLAVPLAPAALLSSLASSAAAQTATAPAVPEVVRLGYAGGPRVWMLGKADGSYEKAFGTKVQWVPFNSGADVLTLLAAKELDIVRFGSSPAVAGIIRKLPIEVIGVSGVIATSERLIGRAAVKSVKDLEGRTVGYPANSTAHYALQAALKVNKVDVAKVKQVPLRPADIVAAWKRGDIDAAYVWGPFTQQLEADGGHEVLASRDLQKDGYYVWNNFVARKEFLEKHPQIAVQLLRVFQKNVEQYKRDPEGSAKIVAEHLNVDLAAARSTLAGIEYPELAEQATLKWLGDGTDTADSVIAKGMKDTANFLAEIGEVRKADIPDSFAPWINTRYLREALARKDAAVKP
ncbi:taurine transport system substrate-binding protein [Azospirillum agricola]|uniref:taurine ABC transporter substrate-binding protein n=1 Tax=Azospirillum agricola TaxID=1720247 RepID=UPI001AE81F48|nr:glycine betaine ABC transporter substrate-binding protein [Azospirillum agricola]MBP2231946.1 taurine transport system substrate-binding protein [Azospirillum agricola]